MYHRQPPGHGELPLDAILGAVLRHGRPRSLGPEVFSDELDQLQPRQAGELLGGTVRQVLATASTQANRSTKLVARTASRMIVHPATPHPGSLSVTRREHLPMA